MLKKLLCILIFVSGMGIEGGPQAAAETDFPTAVEATKPVVYFRLDATSGKSEVGSATYQGNSGVTAQSGGAPTGASQYAAFDGKSGLITTTQKGGVSTQATVMAWINLAQLPSKLGRIVYIVGESESGNDLDLQIEPDDYVRFFTAGGGNVQFAMPKSEVLNSWHMVVATLNTVTRVRALYWDGKEVAKDAGGGRAMKTQPLTIGESDVFRGRFFNGGIQDVALWARALTADQVSTLYSAANGTASGGGGATGKAAAGTKSPAASGGTPTTEPFATTAKVEASDAKGPILLKREEQIALMFLTAAEQIERNCQLKLQRACALSELMLGTGGEHMKFDPNKTDPNYTYTLSAGGTAWEAHANAKKAGLKSFYFAAQDIGMVTTTFNTSGAAGSTDDHIMNRGIEGDSFATQ